MKSIKCLLVAIAAMLLPLVGSAQVGVGSWILHNSFNGVDNLVETPSKVYYVSGGSLFSFDKATEEVYIWNMSNKLNSAGVTGIYYNPDKKYLAVTYKDSNIDLLYENGKVVNLSDIKDAVMTEDKTVNHVAFGPDRMYVGTAFGMVVFNDKKGEVIESAKYGKSIDMVATVGEYLLAYVDDDIKFIKQSERINSLDKFSTFSNTTFANRLGFMGLGDDKLLNILKGGSNGNEFFVSTIDFEAKTAYHKNILAPASSKYTGVYQIIPYKDGYAGISNAAVYYVDKTTGDVDRLDIPSNMQSLKYASWNGPASVWVGRQGGCELYDFSGDSPRRLHAAVAGSNLATSEIAKLYVTPSNRIYAANTYANSLAEYSPSTFDLRMNIIDNGDIQKVDIEGTKITHQWCIVEDPDDPNTFYVGTLYKGVVVVKNGKIVRYIDNTNSPIKKLYSMIPATVGIDGIGNLWVLNDHATNDPRYMMLPANKRLLDNTTADDWLTFPVTSKRGDCVTYPYGCKHTNMMFIPNKPYWKKEMFVYDHKGTVSTTDDKFYYVTNYMDQDGKEFLFNHIGCLVEDHDGRLWIGTDDGVFEITNPAAIDGPVVTINHLKVPRNDGTGLADYLLSSQAILGMSVDSANRKWIATKNNGVYLVSPNGDEILEHYTKENSGLPSDKVLAVAVEPGDDPTDNRVYFGTEFGLVEYRSTSAPAQPNFDNVYAYPNPVRPDYTGWITITGLMDDSRVKITDASGQIVFDGQSQGGMLTWDGCNLNGSRVRTGVYYVLASVKNGSESVVTKILVVK